MARAERIGAEQEGVLSRRQLYGEGVTRWQVAARVRARRWAVTGRQTVSLTTGALSPEARRWVALHETGPRAALAGVTALQAAGVTGLSDEAVHVIVPKSSSPWRSRGVVVHESRRFDESTVVASGIRRVRPAVAAVHAALWAATDRQAAFFLVLPVQQRIVTAEQLHEALSAVRRAPRRRLLLQVTADVGDGAHSLNELDLGRALRRRGLPEPTRQQLVRLPSGRVYLDLVWEQWGVALEVDGAQHEQATARLDDALRDLGVAGTGRTTVRLPVLALRLDEERVLDGIETMLRARGWTGDARPAAA